MKRNLLRNSYAICFTLLVLFAIGLHHNKFLGYTLQGTGETERIVIGLEQAQIFFEDIVTVQQKEKWFEAYDSQGKLLGYLLHSNLLSPEVKGYNGRVPLIIGLDTERTIKKIVMLPNRETGDFVEILREKHLLDAWNHRTVKEGVRLPVDAISGATETSEAIIANVRHSLAAFTPESEALVTNSEHHSSTNVKLRYFGFALFVLLALFSFFFPAKTRKYRMVLLFLSVLVMGFWLTKMLSLAALYQWVLNGFSLNTQLMLIVLLFLGIGLPLLTGKNFYCNYVCPYGSLQELCGKAPVRRIKLSDRLYFVLKQFRKYFLAAIVALLLLGWSFDLTKVEPFLAFNFQIASLLVIILASVFVVLSFFIKRPWCNYFCPTGYVLSLFKKSKK